jgi:hypothetical protein
VALDERAAAHAIGRASTSAAQFLKAHHKPNGGGNDQANPIVGIKSTELLNIDIPPREIFLAPWIAAQSLAMVFANRGTGKTWLMLSTGLALARGSDFLSWTASRPCKVAYVEGELPLALLQSRLRMLGAHENLTLINPELQPDLFLPHLASEQAQNLFEPIIVAHEVILLDSLATLAPTSLDTDSTTWASLQPWLLSIRRRGKAAVFAHHTNRAGTQRGVSNREDVLDFVLKLENVSEDRCCRFKITFEKTRQFDQRVDPSASFAPLEAELRDGKWVSNPEDQSQLMLVVDLTLENKPIRKIADITGLPKTIVNRLQKEARARGIL